MTEAAVAPNLAALSSRIGHRFTDESLLDRAMAHRSWCSENGGVPSNERLEFLGDAVLGLVVTDHTYAAYGDYSEGELAKLRAAVVNASELATAARELGIGDTLLLGKGEDLSGGRDKQSILADAFEAVIGAIYLDGGLDAARSFVLRHLGDRIATAGEVPGLDDYKTRLQEIAARAFEDVPVYHLIEHGPDHRKRFVASVAIGGDPRGHGEGRSKKAAEQAAARDAWHRLNTTEPPESDTPNA